MYMALEVGLDVLYIRTNLVTYVIGWLCFITLKMLLVTVKALNKSVICRVHEVFSDKYS